MHEKAFSNSFQPQSTTVFGIVLENFAIGHEIALVRQENPIINYGEKSFLELDTNAKKLALTMAVEVCGKLRLLSKLCFMVRVCIANEKQLESEINNFRNYRNAGSQDLPLAKMPRQQGIPFRYFGAPQLASLLNYVTEKHTLLIESHFEGSPLNFPLGLAQILYATHLESNGQIWVKNHQEMERDSAPKEGVGLNEKVLTGEEAEKAFAEAVASANKGNK